MVSATQPANGTKLNGRLTVTTGRNRRQSPHVEQSTLRDQFAAAALQGIMANPSYSAEGAVSHAIAVEDAWYIADEMIAARSKSTR